MFTRLGFATLASAAFAQEPAFQSYNDNNVRHDFRVIDGVAEFKLYQVLQPIPICAPFFGAPALPNPFVTEALGLKITCTNQVENGTPFAFLQIEKLSTIELETIARGGKIYKFLVQPSFSASYSELADKTCDVNCEEERYAGKNFDVLTYNAYLRQGVNIATMYSEDDHNIPRVNAMAKEFANYDIVALQEVFAPLDEGRKEQLIRDAAAEGLNHYSTPPASLPAGKTNDSGLLILSRFRIVDTDFLVFSESEATSNRSIQYAKI